MTLRRAAIVAPMQLVMWSYPGKISVTNGPST